MALLLAALAVVVVYAAVRSLMNRQKRQGAAGERKVATARQDAADRIMHHENAPVVKPAASGAPVPAAVQTFNHLAQPASEIPTGGDNLELIQGITPKIAGVLQRVGVITFAQLAAMDSSDIRDILEGVGLRMVDPRTWPNQAGLAAVGDMEGLKTMQERIKSSTP